MSQTTIHANCIGTLDHSLSQSNDNSNISKPSFLAFGTFLIQCKDINEHMHKLVDFSIVDQINDDELIICKRMHAAIPISQSLCNSAEVDNISISTSYFYLLNKMDYESIVRTVDYVVSLFDNSANVNMYHVVNLIPLKLIYIQSSKVLKNDIKD